MSVRRGAHIQQPRSHKDDACARFLVRHTHHLYDDSRDIFESRHTVPFKYTSVRAVTYTYVLWAPTSNSSDVKHNTQTPPFPLLYTCVFALIHSCTHAVMFSCIHVFMYSCNHTYTHVLMYSCSEVIMYSCSEVIMYSCIYVLK